MLRFRNILNELKNTEKNKSQLQYFIQRQMLQS